jgi:hypothetical protein
MDALTRRVVTPPLKCLFLAVVLSGCQTDSAAQETQRFENDAFNLSVEFPAGLTVCTASSGQQPHGFFVRLEDHVDCQATIVKPSVSGISVDAYSNTAFWATPEEVAASLCEVKPAVATTSLQGLTFVGIHSVVCEVTRPDGSIDVFVVAQAGQWPGSQNSPELSAPYINYTASLHTTAPNIARDLLVFRNVLRGIRIE